MTSQRSPSSSDHRAAVRQLPLLAAGVPGVTMQTTSRSVEPMGGLYGGDALGAALVDARQRTLALYGHLGEGELAIPQLDTVNPANWELSHIAWFQEHWCLREGHRDRATLLPDADAFFDSSAVPHRTRWSLPYPSWARLREYMDDTLDATLERLARTAPEARYFFELALLHEDMHGEALAMTLQTLALPAPAFARPGPVSPAPAKGDVAFEGGEFLMGARRAERGFVFDNEKWAHPVRVAPFAISVSPVTQGEYRAFVEDGGGAMPRDWRRSAGAWQRRAFDRWIELEPHAPVVNVSLDQARAYCGWAGRRLPSEAEWEFAATNGGAEDRYPWGGGDRALRNLDMRHSAPCADGSEPASKRGLRGLIGGTWEWTGTAFAPYPEFRPDPYRDYSQPWFHTHHVLRGGSFVTRSRLAHNRFRNFYMPHRDDAFAGFRTCALVS